MIALRYAVGAALKAFLSGGFVPQAGWNRGAKSFIPHLLRDEAFLLQACLLLYFMDMLCAKILVDEFIL